jgi:hypothetical protein
MITHLRKQRIKQQRMRKWARCTVINECEVHVLRGGRMVGAQVDEGDVVIEPSALSGQGVLQAAAASAN